MSESKPTMPVGVSVLLVNRDGRVALGERAADTSAGGFLSTPGGRIEEHEHLAETAARELEEETGVKLLPTQFRVLGFREHFRFGGHYMMIYVAARYDGVLERKEPDKCLGWTWWKIAEIPKDRCTEPEEILDQLRLALAGTCPCCKRGPGFVIGAIDEWKVLRADEEG